MKGFSVRLQALTPLILALLVTSPLPRQSASGQPHVFLRTHIGFSDAELSVLDRGQPVTKTLAVSEKREFAVLGAVRIRGPKQAFLERYRDIAGFRKSQFVPQVAKFSSPPRLEDLQSLTLDAQDLKDLQRCKVGDCKLRLSAAAIERFQREVNWRSADADDQANAIMKDLLREHVNAYVAGGNGALGQYDDRRPPLRLGDESKRLLGQSPYLVAYVPEFHRYLFNFPNATLPHTEDFLYWAKETFGFKPVVSVTHVTIHTPEVDEHPITLIAAKQIYASHYFDASLGFTALIDGPATETGPGFYIVYLNRSLVSRLGGLFGGMIRSRLQSRVRDTMDKGLRVVKERLEKASDPTPSPGRIE